MTGDATKTEDEPALPARGNVLGIDVGWSTDKRTTALCCLSWDEDKVEWQSVRCVAKPIEHEKAFEEVVGSRSLLAVAIDGPLGPDLDIIGHYRSAERILSRGDLLKIGKAAQSSTENGKRLNKQANIWANIASDSNQVATSDLCTTVASHKIAEAFPTTFLGVLIDDPSLLGGACRSDVYFLYLALCRYLDTFLTLLGGDKRWLRPLTKLTDHDERAAFVCALTAICVASGSYVAVGDDQDGWIHLPPRRMIRPWALEALAQNEGREKDEKGTKGQAVLVEREEASSR